MFALITVDIACLPEVDVATLAVTSIQMPVCFTIQRVQHHPNIILQRIKLAPLGLTADLVTLHNDEVVLIVLPTVRVPDKPSDPGVEVDAGGSDGCRQAGVAAPQTVLQDGVLDYSSEVEPANATGTV